MEEIKYILNPGKYFIGDLTKAITNDDYENFYYDFYKEHYTEGLSEFKGKEFFSAFTGCDIKVKSDLVPPNKKFKSSIKLFSILPIDIITNPSKKNYLSNSNYALIHGIKKMFVKPIEVTWKDSCYIEIKSGKDYFRVGLVNDELEKVK